MLIAAVTGLILSPSSNAQPWEYVYGGNTSREVLDRSEFILSTCDNGYIAVTTTDNVGTGRTTKRDIYVVKLNQNGTKAWERTYDLNNANGNDEGHAIIALADGSGYVVAGRSDAVSNQYDACILRLNCDGEALWSYFYGSSFGSEVAYDILETTTGGPGNGQGDFILAGTSTPNGGQADAMLMRITPAGTIGWAKVYDHGSVEEFYKAAELTPDGSNINGDIIAVGKRHTQSTPRGYVVRVAGATGLVTGGSFTGAATFGLDREMQFRSVIELQNPNEIGTSGVPNVVIVGEQRITNRSVVAVKLDNGDPCRPLIQRVVSATGNNWAYDVKETPCGSLAGSIQQWDLVVTGATSAPGNTDIFLLNLRPGGLTLGGLANHFGGAATEEGRSIVVHPSTGCVTSPLFLISGYSTSDLGREGDTRDMYLIKTDGLGETGCQNSFIPTETTFPSWECVTPTIGNLEELSPGSGSKFNVDWGKDVCPRPNKLVPTTGTVGADMARVLVGENPVSKGTPIALRFENVASATPVSIDAVNALGVVVDRTSGTVSNVDAISTDGWTAGVYHLVVRHGESTSMLRVVVE